MSGKPLKMKDLIDVKFTEIKDPSDKRSTIVKDARYMCPVTRDTLGNSLPCAVIRTTYVCIYIFSWKYFSLFLNNQLRLQG